MNREEQLLALLRYINMRNHLCMMVPFRHDRMYWEEYGYSNRN